MVSWEQLEAFRCTVEQQWQGMLSHRLVTDAAPGGTGKRLSGNPVPLLPGHGTLTGCAKNTAPQPADRSFGAQMLLVV